MKKAALLIIALLLVFPIMGCEGNQQETQQTTQSTTAPAETEETTMETTEATEPEITVPAVQTTVYGVDITGMSAEQACAAITERISTYTLELRVNGTKLSFTAEDLSLTCQESAVAAYLEAIEKGEPADASQLLSYNTDSVKAAVSDKLDVSAKNAQITYDSANDTFKLTSEKSGQTVDADSAAAQADPYIRNLDSSAAITVAVSKIEPTLKADSAKAKAALENANTYLDISLQYTYTPDDIATKTEVMSTDTIASLISFKSDLSPAINSSALSSYVASMNEKYAAPGTPGKFQATGGSIIDITVTYAGQPVDTDALYGDIAYCITNHISGTRTAPYKSKTEVGDLSFGGNYVEINLSSQHLWVYKNGKCMVSTPIVSGRVSTGWVTPTGVYSVTYKTHGAWLTGTGYRSWVDYWMPFFGNYGMHDASWRSSFGGDIYLTEGSHGCVNIPPSAADDVYNNISAGTKVVIYGGATKTDPVQQTISGTGEYTVASNAAPFTLDASLAYDVTSMSYSSDNTDVVTVSNKGEVTVKGVGSANIKITAPATKYYTAAEFTVKVTVVTPCEAGQHTLLTWTQTKAPTCAPGEESAKCEYCDHVEARPLPAVAEHTPGQCQTEVRPGCETSGLDVIRCTVCQSILEQQETTPTDHSFSPDHAYCQNGCGTANPDYVPPESTEGKEDPEGSGGDPAGETQGSGSDPEPET